MIEFLIILGIVVVISIALFLKDYCSIKNRIFQDIYEDDFIILRWSNDSGKFEVDGKEYRGTLICIKKYSDFHCYIKHIDSSKFNKKECGWLLHIDTQPYKILYKLQKKLNNGDIPRAYVNVEYKSPLTMKDLKEDLEALDTISKIRMVTDEERDKIKSKLHNKYKNLMDGYINANS